MFDRLRTHRSKAASSQEPSIFRRASPHLESSGDTGQSTDQSTAQPKALGQSPLSYSFSQIPIHPQAKLTVSQPSDPAEQEADRVADQVMRMEMPESTGQLALRSIQRSVQRQPGAGGIASITADSSLNQATQTTTLSEPVVPSMNLRPIESAHDQGCGCSACRTVARKPDDLSCQTATEANQQTASPTSSPTSVTPAAQIEIALQSGGTPLNNATRAFMEPRLGHDFSRVRVHNDAAAATSAQSIQAAAYTVGQDIVFAPGQYTPGTPQGKQLLAHELTHVVQQQAAEPIGTQTKSDSSDPSVHDPSVQRSTSAAPAPAEEPIQVQQQVQPALHRSWFSDAVSSVGDAVGSAVDTVGDVASSAVGAVGDAIGSVADGVSDAMSSAWNAATTFLGDAASSVWSGLKSLGNDVLDVLSQAGSAVWGAIRWFGELAWDGLRALGGFLWEKLSLLGTLAWTFIRNIPTRLWRIVVLGWEGLTGAVGWLWEGLRGAGSWAWDAVTGAFSWLGQGLAGAWSWLGDGLSRGADWAIDFVQNPSLDKLWSGLLGSLGWLGEGVKGLAKWGWDGIVAAAQWAWRGLKGLADWLWEGFLGGLEWAGRMLLLLLEALGMGEILQLLWGLIFHLRPLTSEEISASLEVHVPGQIPYSEIRVDENSIIAQISGYFSGGSGARAVTTLHILNVAAGEDIHTMVHELSHVAQYEVVGAVYMAEAIHAQQWGGGYSYDIAQLTREGKHFSDLNREQQAQICEDYYKSKHGLGGSTTDLQPFVDEMRRGQW